MGDQADCGISFGTLPLAEGAEPKGKMEAPQMDDVESALREPADGPDDENFFTQWRRFINGPLAAAGQVNSEQSTIGLRHHEQR
ncbi:hypothetical protein [Novosphingobium sp. JCM 18896]|uniref:hypothetical protein n=1 Tax=Novosphingobium sp. JCM 18896 TaxID=2989731 RepID=UPI0022227FB8|nr:hypothetical protein [Novosphingobium sp. JCM 18896]MCW1432105.1 hypothetical protein [Novosphingobium sp. JCM 18896]